MMPRLVTSLLVSLALVAIASSVFAQDKTHEGTVVSAAEGKLVMTDKGGKDEHTHMIAATTKVTLDGKAAKLEDLKKGDSVKVTTDAGGKVTAVAATRSTK
jgi:formylmethanofuran dehydrogenase subunit D